MRIAITRRAQSSGFTLIELMVVIVLIGVLSAMIIPEMRGSFEDALLRSTSRNLIDACQTAYSRSVSFNQTHRLRLDTRNGRYLLECLMESPRGEEFAPVQDVAGAEGELDPRISVTLHRPGEEPSSSGMENPDALPASEPAIAPLEGAISFYADGTADATEIVLQDRQGFRLALRINPVTARVHITELARQ